MADRLGHFKASPADELRVLAILRESRTPRVWSSIACELHGIRRATLEQVCGVRDACRELEAKGLIHELPPEEDGKRDGAGNLLPTLRFEAVRKT